MIIAGPLLILVFLLLTIAISAFEKLSRWKNSLEYYVALYQETLSAAVVKAAFVLIVGLEFIISILIIWGMYELIYKSHTFMATLAILLSSVLFIILLIGLRILKDYDGAGRTAVYFLLAVFGLFWLQSI